MSSLNQIEKMILSLLINNENYISDERLVCNVGISFIKVWKSIKSLINAGLKIETKAGKGYRLEKPIILLNASIIHKNLPKDLMYKINLYVLDLVNSTNDWLWQRNLTSQNSSTLVLAEAQTAGRGRIMREWKTPFGYQIACSWFETFADDIDVSGLSLAIGIVVLKTLNKFGINNIKLKWPNDLLDDKGNKLAGILVELKRGIEGINQIVIGIGINCLKFNFPKMVALEELSNNLQIDRNKIVSYLIIFLDQLFTHFREAKNLNEYFRQWHQYDAYYQKHVQVIRENCICCEGTNIGIDDKGNLLIQNSGMITHIYDSIDSIRLA